MILDSSENGNDSIILGRPFLATARVIVDIEQGELTLRMHEESITLKVFPELQRNEETSKTSGDFLPKQATDKAVEQKNKQLQEEKGIQKEAGVINKKEGITTQVTVKKERSTRKKNMTSKNKAHKGWKNKKIPTEGFSKGDKVQLVYQQLGTEDYYTVNQVLSLEHMEIEHQGTQRKLTVRGDKLRHHQHQPP